MAFLLHLYQPPTQTEAAFKVIAHECYIPLIKLIKSKSSCKFTLNVPLSLLEQLEKYGYSGVISQIKELVDAERVELSGSAAYHPLLTKTTEEFIYKQVILNEYGLGYYFGQRQGFEGEISMMARDIRGFFPPELAISTEVLKVVDDLNYDWVVVSESSIPDKLKNPSGLYTVADMRTKILSRDTVLSNLISFKRDDTVDDLGSYILQQKESGKDFLAVALDGEVFGHHNKDGLYLLESLIDSMAVLGVNLVTVSEAIERQSSVQLPNILDSTWSDGVEPYALWDSPTNITHKKLWKLQNLVTSHFMTLPAIAGEDGFENVPTWKDSELAKISNVQFKEFVALELLVLKSMHSDKFWWISNATICDKLLLSPSMVRNALVIYKMIAEFEPMLSIAEEIHQLSADIEGQLS